MSANPEKDSWLYHAQGYLKLARLCCQELLKPHHKWSEDNPRVPENWRSLLPTKYHIQDLLPGILFNIKHAVEIFLKSALIDLGIPNYRNHDVVKLFSEIENIVFSTTWQPLFLESTGQYELSEEEIERIKNEVMPRLKSTIRNLQNNQILDDQLNAGI